MGVLDVDRATRNRCSCDDALKADGGSREPDFPRPLDTTADAHTLQGDIYRRFGGRARLDIMFRLSASIRHLAMSGIRARHPGYSDRQVLESYARLVWGDELARAVFSTGEPAEP